MNADDLEILNDPDLWQAREFAPKYWATIFHYWSHKMCWKT